MGGAGCMVRVSAGRGWEWMRGHGECRSWIGLVWLIKVSVSCRLSELVVGGWVDGWMDRVSIVDRWMVRVGVIRG